MKKATKKPPQPARERLRKKSRTKPLPKIERKHKALRTYKANLKHGSIKQQKIQSNKHDIVDLRIAGHSEQDIADALGISQQRVSQLLKETLEERKAQTADLTEHYVDMELRRIDFQILAWHKAARHDPRASDVYLSWVERRHKLLGLDITKQDINVRGGGVRINASEIDLSKLNDQQLIWLEEIMRIAGPKIEEDDSVIANQPTKLLEQPVQPTGDDSTDDSDQPQEENL